MSIEKIISGSREIVSSSIFHLTTGYLFTRAREINIFFVIPIFRFDELYSQINSNIKILRSSLKLFYVKFQL